jgi:hypothetical protein
MKQPSVKTRKDLFGRDVKVTRNKDVKTKEVTGNYVAKTKVVKKVPGGKNITKSRMEVDPSMGYGSVRNVNKYTGLAGLKKELDMKKSTDRKKISTMAAGVNPTKAKLTKNKLTVREMAQKKYKGTNMPKKFNG